MHPCFNTVEYFSLAFTDVEEMSLWKLNNLFIEHFLCAGHPARQGRCSDEQGH